MASRYVVRFTGLDSWITKPPKEDHHWTAERIKKVIEDEKQWKGWFVKVGGGRTQDLSEAQVIGWGNHKRWNRPEYELVPVQIVVKS